MSIIHNLFFKKSQFLNSKQIRSKYRPTEEDEHNIDKDNTLIDEVWHPIHIYVDEKN